MTTAGFSSVGDGVLRGRGNERRRKKEGIVSRCLAKRYSLLNNGCDGRTRDSTTELAANKINVWEYSMTSIQSGK